MAATERDDLGLTNRLCAEFITYLHEHDLTTAEAGSLYGNIKRGLMVAAGDHEGPNAGDSDGLADEPPVDAAADEPQDEGDAAP